MAFGIPSTSDLTALATQLGNIVAGVGPMEQGVITAAIQQLSDHATALETKAALDLESDAGAIITSLDTMLTKQRQALFAELDARLPATLPLWSAPKS